MKIRDGYNDKETYIELQTTDKGVNLHIRLTGMEGINEHMVSMTVDELLELFLEVKTAGRDLFC